MACDHDFSVPLYAQADTGEWLPIVVGVTCSKCWLQAFDGDTLTWTVTSNTTEFISVSA